MREAGGERGQASVELVALLPLIAVLGLVLWQAVVAGQAVWLAGSAARVAARAEAVGGDGDQAARGVLPRALRRGLRVRPDQRGGVAVAIRIPAVLAPGSVATVRAFAHFEPQLP
jgi:hypothetical protein